MSPAYDEAVGPRRARLGAAAVAQGEVLAQAYDVAMQVVGLREKHGLTQAQLAER